MNVLIVGANSAIARETARHFAASGDRLFLIGRNAEKLAATASDLRSRGAASVDTLALDLTEAPRHALALEKAEEICGKLDVALVAHGVYSAEPEEILSVNLVSTISILNHLALGFEKRRGGVIAVISSISGDRGRAGQGAYSASKAGLDAFLSGLRQRLFRSGVTVMTVKPGPVDTPMAAGLQKSLLTASASSVGKGIHRAILRKKDVVYLPWFWGVIMRVIRLIPEPIFKRLSF